jgi:hypothetical protein
MKIEYDLHIHSALSPCSENDMTPGNIVGMAFINGLDLIALTDHQSCANVRSAIAAADNLRAQNKKAPVILPGMEIECSEGFHLLAYFPDPDTADQYEMYLTKHRLIIPNRPEIFGDQYLFDITDEICGTMSDLLLTSVDLASGQIETTVRDAGGLIIPAHIDRHSYSMLESLGCIPQEYKGHILEISKDCIHSTFLETHPELKVYKFLKNSDAHRLCDISDFGRVLEFPFLKPATFDATHVVQALREMSFK